MADFELLHSLAIETPSKIVMFVIDGLGGLPKVEGGDTELEAARIPNLDRLAARSICGLTDPVSPGITPGSGPAHLALFGYDPLKYDIGRGVLEALGIDFNLRDTDVAARGNFCTIDEKGNVIDRRAGRVETSKTIELCKLLQDKVKIEGVQVIVEPVKEHRFVVIFRGEGLSGDLADSDPQITGVPPLAVEAQSPEARKTADIANEFQRQAKQILANHKPVNMLLLRGFAKHPSLPQMNNIYKLKTAAIAIYPMYRGLGKLVGMQALPSGQAPQDEIEALRANWDKYDFFYIHFKRTDSAGEDGDFDRKVEQLEEADSLIPDILSLNPDVLVVTGDHSTPSMLAAHSWHTVPFMLFSKSCRTDSVKEFSESACIAGGLGRFPAKEAMALIMANALKLNKYGA